jgi:amidase
MQDIIDLYYLSAIDALLLFRTGELSPVGLLEAIIERNSNIETKINAFADTYYDEALSKARAAEGKYSRGETIRALEGLPLAVKDDTAIEGRVTTIGSMIYKDHIDDHTNPSVQRLLDSGAILFARTTCPEFCWPWVCYSRLHGVTRNPWNLHYTPGGSSGGSAAALAGGMTVLASGTDSAGSIRMPASMCGVVGYKPPYGRNPESPSHNLDIYNAVGPMTRTVADNILMQNVMAGPHPLDQATVKPKVHIPLQLDDVGGMKIAYSVDLGTYEVAQDVRLNTMETLAVLKAAGAELHEVDMQWAEKAILASGNYGDHLYADRFINAVEAHGDIVTDYTPYFAELAARVSQEDFHHSLVIGGESWLNFSAILEEYDAFICPTVATTEMPADRPPMEGGFEVNGVEVDPNGGWVMTILFNMFNRCPVLAVPSGLASNGVPTGIQIVGRTFDDVTVFRVGMALEKERGWFETEELRPTL